MLKMKVFLKSQTEELRRMTRRIKDTEIRIDFARSRLIKQAQMAHKKSAAGVQSYKKGTQIVRKRDLK